MTRTQVLNMRRTTWMWLAAGLFAGLLMAFGLSGVQTAAADGNATGNESITLSTNEIDFETGKSRSKESVWIRGSGFTPGQEITLVASGAQGALYEISTCRWKTIGVCDPKKRKDGGGVPYPLVANGDGAFASSWLLGRFTRKNVGEEAMITILAVDTATYTNLASAPLALCNLNNRGEGEEVPDFCSA